MMIRKGIFKNMFNQIKNLISNNILKSSAGILLITILVKVLGYAEKLLLARYFGTSYQVDVYTVVLTIVLSIFFFFREIIEPGYLNVFLDCRKNKEGESWMLFNGMFRLVFVMTLIISVVAVLFPVVFSNIFAPGFEGKKFELANVLIRIAVPAGIFLALSTLTSITLNGMKIFVLPASGELVFKAVIIAFMVLFYKDLGIVGATIGIVIGSFGRLGVHLTKLYKKLSLKKITIEQKYKSRIWQLTWPLLLGVGFSQVSSLVDNVFASYLQEGAIAALSYAKKVVELPVILFPYVLSIIIFPYFTQLSVERQRERLKKLLAGSLKWILIAFLPISVFFIAFSTIIIEVIFQRGAFDVNSTLLTAKPFMVYSIGLVFFAIETILVIFYYSSADTKTPVFVGMGCVVINIILTWFFVRTIGYIGIALAFVLQKMIKNLLLLLLLKYKIDFSLAKVGTSILKIIFSAVLMVGVVLLGKYLLNDFLSYALPVKLGVLGLIFGVSSILYLVVLHLLKILKISNLF
jgi:putative peptidoglycan lipid II flippase